MARLTVGQEIVGKYPWVEVEEFGSRFLQVDTKYIPDFKAIAVIMSLDDGIPTSCVKSLTDGRTYLRVGLDGDYGKKLDELRIKSTEWSQTLSPRHDRSIYTATVASDFQREAPFGSKERIFNDRVLKDLAKAYVRQGLDVSVVTKPGGQLVLEVPESQASKLRVLQGYGTFADNLKMAYVEPMYPAIKTAAIGAGLGVVAAGPVAYDTYQHAKEQLEQGNSVGAGTTVLNNAAEFVAGGVCGSGAAVAALPVLAVPVAGEITYGAAVLGAGYACAKATKDFIETSQYFTDQIKQHALNNGLDPDKSVEQLQHVSRQIPYLPLEVNQGQSIRN